MNKEKHVIVISYDAFSKDNWEAAKKLPNMAKLLQNGAYTTGVKSVYPTLTYVIHSSYVTGMYPNKHGVYHNNPLQPFEPEQDQAWHWFRSDIKEPTIYEAVAGQGMTVAGILWPVTGKATIKYNIPEIKAVKKENQALKVLKSGSKLYSLSMELKYGKIRNGIQQPALDDFITACAVDTIKNKKPNLLLMHLIDLDDTKHLLGTKGPHIQQVIERMDKRLGLIMQAVKDAGNWDQTTFIIVGDHGQLDVQYKVHLNKLLKDVRLIYKENGKMKWRAYVQGAGGAAYLHIQDGDVEAEKLALDILREAMDEDIYGIEAIYTRSELDALHVDQQFKYMLEAKSGYAFEDALDQPVIYDLHAQSKVYATHGYSPLKPDYTSNFVASGAGIKNGFTFEQMEVIDLAPTIGRLLNVPFENCDGRVVEEIFEC